jgi:hypothetical protein
VKCLAGPARGPGDLERPNGGGLADSDRQGERVAAVARTTGDLAVPRDQVDARIGEIDPDSRADGRSVGLGADQPNGEPVVAVVRVLK